MAIEVIVEEINTRTPGVYVVTEQTTKKEYQDNILKLNPGDFFKFQYPFGFLTMQNRIKEAMTPDMDLFDVQYVPMGHSLYAVYGPNTVVVTAKRYKNQK
jgi:hypothetical protein